MFRDNKVFAHIVNSAITLMTEISQVLGLILNRSYKRNSDCLEIEKKQTIAATIFIIVSVS